MERAVGHGVGVRRNIITEGDTSAAVHKLLDELRDRLSNVALNPKTRDRIDEISDSIETLTVEALTPQIGVDWREWELTPIQQRIARALHRRKGHLVTKDAIMGELYFDRPSGNNIPEIKIVDVLVCNTRKKLKGGDCPFRIETVWGQGYRMVLASQPVHDGCLDRKNPDESASYGVDNLEELPPISHAFGRKGKRPVFGRTG